MKNYSNNLLTLIAATAMLAAPALATAQHQVQLGELTQHPVEKDAQVIPFKGEVAAEKAGVAYYTEDFDAGLNGWTVNTTVGSVDWAWTDVGPGPTSSTYPCTCFEQQHPTGMDDGG